MKSVLLVISACIVILFLPAILDSVNSFRSTDYDVEYDATTSANVTSADIVLSQELFDENTAFVTVTSNLTLDAPVPSSYDEATQTLTIDGLEANESRRLSLTYKIPSLDTYTGADVGAKIWPLMLVLGVIGIIAGAVYNAVRHGE